MKIPKDKILHFVGCSGITIEQVPEALKEEVANALAQG